MIARPMRLAFLPLALLLLTTHAPAQGPTARRAVPVRVVKGEGGYELHRAGKPYLVKGVGLAGDGSIALLAAMGGNSVRTWGAEGLGKTLDEAHRQGLTVAVGIWLGHERHGFNYHDAGQVAKQFDDARRVILQYKDHPAVLLWGLGNEMEAEGTNVAVWSAIDRLAAMAKQIDPDHPTMTVLAEIGGPKVRNLHRLCPNIDIVGINSYGGVASVPRRYREAGGTKPYLLTEFGATGMWETGKNAWGVAPEPSSTAKAGAYRLGYETGLADKGRCLGSYAFLWGTKQEGTATWFGILLPDGSRLAAADTLADLWGKPPVNRCPSIEKLAIEGPDQVAPGPTIRASLAISDPEGDPLTVQWLLRAEVSKYSSGGDREQAPPEFPSAIVASDRSGATVKLPEAGGGYRLFAYVRDGHGGAAVANAPLFVKAPGHPAPGR
jgi:hypothetical protein